MSTLQHTNTIAKDTTIGAQTLQDFKNAVLIVSAGTNVFFVAAWLTLSLV